MNEKMEMQNLPPIDGGNHVVRPAAIGTAHGSTPSNRGENHRALSHRTRRPAPSGINWNAAKIHLNW